MKLISQDQIQTLRAFMRSCRPESGGAYEAVITLLQSLPNAEMPTEEK